MNLPRYPDGVPGERGMALVTLLATVTILTVISLSLAGLMRTDITHASIQNTVARSFYIAQAGLAEAKVKLGSAPDPVAYTTPAEGVTVAYGGGQFTYWVDAGPADGCGDGLKTLEAIGQVAFLTRTFSTRIRACGVPGVPFLAALFGVSRVEFHGAASRTYLAPYIVGTPGGGGSVGSYTEIHFADPDVRVNALSEDTTDTVALRDGRFFDYSLFGFPARPAYNPTPGEDPTPWILPAFGDVIKAQPPTGPVPNPCGTSYACVTVAGRVADVDTIAELRLANYVRHVYAMSMRNEVVPPLVLDGSTWRLAAERNTANAAVNEGAGLQQKTDSVYALTEFSQLLIYLASHPTEYLQGTVYVEGTVQFTHSVNLGGSRGNATLVVAGDLIVDDQATLRNQHDLSTIAGRRIPGIVVLGSPALITEAGQVCGGERVYGSGRFVLCGGGKLVVDGLVYTRDGMVVEPMAYVDQVGAMYHDNRSIANSSFITRDATVILRFDPLALSVFQKGVAILSWQQLH